jgi:hypothetical protein
MIEFLIELLGEFLLQVLVEALIELGLHVVSQPLRGPPTAWLAALGYTLLGAVVGAMSLLPFPAHFVPTGIWQFVNLIVTPVAAGLCMSALGAWRASRGHSPH